MSDNHQSEFRQKEKEKETNEKSMGGFSPVFHFNSFKVGNLENASAINFGNNYPNNFRGYKRQSQGFGTIDGDDNNIHDIEPYMNQRFFMDAIMDNQEELPDWIKELINSDEMMNKDFWDDNKLEIYHQIKSLLKVDEVPEFFRKLAKRKHVLEKLWETIHGKWNDSEEFNLFYHDVLTVLNNQSIPTNDEEKPKLKNESCKELADRIEQYAKSLLVIIYILKSLSPDYFKDYEGKGVDSTVELEISNDNVEKIHQIIEVIKERYNLSELNLSIIFTKENPKILEYAFLNIIKPMSETNNDTHILKALKQLIKNTAQKIKGDLYLDNLKSVDKEFLTKQSIKYLESYCTYIFLEYLFIPLCE